MLGERAVIFASVGSMLPFDRLVRAVDEWAGANPEVAVFIQTGGGDYVPRHAEHAQMVPLAEYRRKLGECRLFVAHAGMGSIFQALEARRQMLLMPRDRALGEHTTDHQAATMARFRDRSGLEFAGTIEELQQGMTRLLANPIAVSGEFSPKASPRLLAAVRGFLGAAGS